MRLAFIVQRYGKEILGGSETLARQLAERLSRRNEVTVLTTTAKDYITWKSEYPPGEDTVRGVRVIRFQVEGERDLESFNQFSEEIYKGQPTREQELEWLHRQGPVVPQLVDFLKKEHEKFDLLVFFTYLYYPTYYGLQVAPEKSVLLPTAHDEPPLKLGIFREMFQLPSSFLFNSEAEELLVLERFPVHKKMRETIGIGMELLDQPDINAFRKKHDIPGKYLLYAGRIDAGKGLEELFRYFDFYKEEHPGSGNLQLILIGKLSMRLPARESIRYIGFVDEGDKLSALAGAVAVVQPSRMESLSIVTLEAMSVGTPVVVNAASRVLIDHCRRSNAGLYYSDFEEFEEILNLLLTDRNLARSMGRNGQTYIKESYGWNKLLAKYELVFRSSARPAREGREPREARPARLRPPVPAASPERRESETAVREDDDLRTEELPLLEPDGDETLTDEESPFRVEDSPPEPAEQGEGPGRWEEEADETLAEVPSFYRSSIPPDAGPEPEPAAEEIPEREPASPVQEEATDLVVEESSPEPQEAEPQEAEEEGLPEFYRPRPRPATRNRRED